MAKENKQKSAEDVQAERTVSVFYALVVLILGAFIGYFVYANAVAENAKHPFNLGLDLAGGAHLVYEADVSGIEEAEVPELMSVLRDVIERRVNIFGVSEPIVQVEESSFVTDEVKHRLVVELPGVSDVDQAIAEIGKTPLLEFKLVNPNVDPSQLMLEGLDSSLADALTDALDDTKTGEVPPETNAFIDTGLTGRYLQSAALEFAGQSSGQLSNEPIVSIKFNEEGGDLFEQITRDNVGGNLAIFLDGQMLSAPRINEAIGGGSAIISGGFDPEEARELAQNLNFGALPVPIELQSTQTIGASLGAEVLDKGVEAAMFGLALVIAFMILWYRLPGLVAGVALLIYVASMLALFQLIPVTLTAAGLAGFVLSIGMAVDANVLVFERMKEEYAAGKNSREAARAGFARAWSAIRDGNVTSILSAVILFWFGTSIVKGFALVFGLGVVVSMLTAVSVTRTLLIALPETDIKQTGIIAKLFISSAKKEV